MLILIFNKINLLRGAERIWPPSGARAQRGRWSEAQRSGAKWRGRGLGQRNSGFERNLQYKPKKEKSGFKKSCFVKTRHSFMLRRPRPRPRGLAAPRSSAAKPAPPSATHYKL